MQVYKEEYPIHHSIEQGELHDLEEYIRRGGDVDAVDDKGRSLLQYACEVFKICSMAMIEELKGIPLHLLEYRMFIAKKQIGMLFRAGADSVTNMKDILQEVNTFLLAHRSPEDTSLNTKIASLRIKIDGSSDTKELIKQFDALLAKMDKLILEKEDCLEAQAMPVSQELPSGISEENIMQFNALLEGWMHEREEISAGRDEKSAVLQLYTPIMGELSGQPLSLGRPIPHDDDGGSPVPGGPYSYGSSSSSSDGIMYQPYLHNDTEPPSSSE